MVCKHCGREIIKMEGVTYWLHTKVEGGTGTRWEFCKSVANDRYIDSNSTKAEPCVKELSIKKLLSKIDENDLSNM